MAFAAWFYRRAVIAGVCVLTHHSHNLIDQFILCQAQYFKTELAGKGQIFIKFGVFYFINHCCLLALRQVLLHNAAIVTKSPGICRDFVRLYKRSYRLFEFHFDVIDHPAEKTALSNVF